MVKGNEIGLSKDLAKAMLKETIDAYKKLIVYINPLFHKQNVDKATEVAGELRRLENFIERTF